MSCEHGCCVLCAAQRRAAELGVTEMPGTSASVLMRGEVRDEKEAGPRIKYAQIWVFGDYKSAEVVKTQHGGGMLVTFKELFTGHGEFFANWHLAPGGEVKVVQHN